MAMVTVVKPVTVHGQQMQPGDKVLLLWSSANRDERVFEDPEAFRLDRRTNPHMSFSHGIHKCAGQHLARLELRVLLEEMLDRMPDYQVGEVIGPSLTGGISWHLDSLPITFTPGPRVGTTPPPRTASDSQPSTPAPPGDALPPVFIGYVANAASETLLGAWWGNAQTINTETGVITWSPEPLPLQLASGQAPSPVPAPRDTDHPRRSIKAAPLTSL